MNALLKSGQPELIYSKALEYYQKEKWQRASTLFEGVQHYYTGSSREDSISFFNARCKYKNRDFDTASTLLDDFRRKFGRSAFIEDAEGTATTSVLSISQGIAEPSLKLDSSVETYEGYAQQCTIPATTNNLVPLSLIHI